MFIGHYSASFVAKRLVPQAPLWLLLIAAQLVDVFWAGFIWSGVERMRLVPQFTQTNPFDLYYMPYTHSLPAALLWSTAAGLLVYAAGKARWGGMAHRVAVAVALVVASHWVLDWLMHKPDLGLWGDQFKVGLGLWDYRWPALGVELVFFGGAALYLRANAKIWQAAGGNRLGIFLAVMVLIHFGNLFGPHPPSADALAIAALAGYLLFAAVAAWLEKRGNPGA